MHTVVTATANEGADTMAHANYPPYARTRSREHSAWYLDHHLITFLATRDDTAGQFSLMEYQGRQGGEPPPHIHPNEDESYYVLDGEFEFTIEGRAYPGTPGTFVLIPRGADHSFTIKTAEATALVFFTPAGFEAYFQEMSEPAESMTMPPDPQGPPDYERMGRVAAQHGCEFVTTRET
jgi:quercetin dioxygenase-like cupin family protein